MDPIGVYEFDLYSPLSSGVFTFAVDSLRFTLAWPAEWTPVAYTLCDGELRAGDPLLAGSELTIAFPTCRAIGVTDPFMRLTLDCTTYGRFSIEPPSGDFAPLAHECGGNWYPEPYLRYVEVGDYCAAVVQAPCTVCPNLGAGTFVPESLAASVPDGETFADTISVGGITSCPGVPLCGSDSGSCLGGVESSEPWLHLELLSRVAAPDAQNRVTYVYRITADTSELGPGVHAARIIAVPGCAGTCSSTCMPLELTVEGPVSVPEPTSVSTPVVALGASSPVAVGDAVSYWIELREPGRVVVSLFDVDGRRTAEVLNRVVGSGRHAFDWTPDAGALQPGVYILRVETSGTVASRKIVMAPRSSP